MTHFSSKRVPQFLKKYLNGETASVLPLAALAFPVVLGMAGLGTDAGLWMAQKRSLQTAADAAVIAAG